VPVPGAGGVKDSSRWSHHIAQPKSTPKRVPEDLFDCLSFIVSTGSDPIQPAIPSFRVSLSSVALVEEDA